MLLMRAALRWAAFAIVGGHDMQIQMVNVSELKPHPKNPRVHPESALEKLQRSIEKFGWTNPILVSADGYILAGHARLKAAQNAGIEQVPVIYLPLEGAKAEAYLIADNRLQEETDWDFELLEQDLKELIALGFDITVTGFDADAIERATGDFYVPDREYDESVADEVETVTCPRCGSEFPA